jgi:GST-like protein
MQKPLLLGSKGWGNAIVECAFALARLDHDFEDVAFREGEPTPANLLERNPLGQVPTLVLPGGTVMTESLAILHYVNDRVPQAGLIPPPGHADREKFYRWAVFIVAALYPTFTYGDFPEKWVRDEGAKKQLRESTDQHRQSLWKQIEAAAGSPWFLGERRSGIDLYLAVMTRWRPGRKWFEANAPQIAAIADRAAAIPEIGEVLKKNFG